MSEVEVTSGDPDVSVVVSEGPAALTVRGYGDSEGDPVAVWTFGALAAAGAGPASLGGVAAPFAADAEALLLPTAARRYPPGSRGIILRSVDSEGDEYVESSFRWGEYGVWTIQLPTAGRQLTARYAPNTGGVNDTGDRVTLTVKAGRPALDRALTVTAHLLQDAVGVTEAEMAAHQAAVNAKDASQDAAIAALQARETTGGVTASEARQIADDEIAAARLAPLAVQRRVLAAHDDAEASTLTLDLVDAAGNVTHLAVHYGGTGDSGLTAQAAVNAALAKLAADVAGFSWDAATRTMTFSAPAPAEGSVTEAMLAQAARDKIDAALRANQVSVVARADIADGALTDAQRRAFLRRIGVTDNDAAPDALPYATTATVAHLQGRAGGVVTPTGVSIRAGDGHVNIGYKGGATVKIAAADILALDDVAEGGENAELTGNAIERQTGDDTWYLAHRGETLYFGDSEAGAAGDVAITRHGYRLAGHADRRKNEPVPANQLPARTGAYSVADEKKLDALGGGNAIASGVFTAAAVDEDTVGADRRPGQRARGAWSGDAGDPDRRALLLQVDEGALAGYFAGTDTADYADLTLRVGERRVKFAHATFSLDETGTPGTVEFSWGDGYDGWIEPGENEWAVEGPERPGVAVERDGTAEGDADVLNFAGDAVEVSTSGAKATATFPRANWAQSNVDAADFIEGKPQVLNADALPFPARQPFTSNKRGRIQVEQHEVIRAVNRAVTFPALRTRAYVPPPPGQPDGSTLGHTAVNIQGVGRLAYYPATEHQAAYRNRFVFTPQTEYSRQFGATQLVVETAPDGTNRQTLALTAAGGILVSDPANAANAVAEAQAGAALQRWVNLVNAAGNAAFVNADDVLPRYLALADLPLELLLRAPPVQEAIARPNNGWPNSAAYVRGAAAPVPLRFAAGLDDELRFRVGFTGHGNDHAIHASHGPIWSPWARAQNAKAWPQLADPWSRGGENPAPRYPGDAATDATAAVNTLRADAHNSMTLDARIGDDGYLRFWASDGWARLGSILVQYGYHYPFAA